MSQHHTKPVSNATAAANDRHRRQLALREAEGYLELATVYDDRWPLPSAVRDQLCHRSLEVLAPLETLGWRRSAVLLQKGLAYKAMERHREALEPLRGVVELEPENTQAWLALGWCYKRTGRLDLAIQALEEGLQADPSLAVLYYNLACYWALARNPKLCVRYLAQAFDIDGAFRDLAPREPDFDPIRRDPAFAALTGLSV